MARIGIDIRKWDDYGIGTYIQALVRGYADNPDGNEFILFCTPGFDSDALPGNFECVEEHSGLYSLFEPFSLGKNIRRNNLDLFHCPHYVTPFRPGCPLVVTIHDLIHLVYPEYLPNFPARLYANYFLNRAAKKAEVILTVSEASKRDILNYLPARDEQVVVTPNGIDTAYFEAPSESVTAEIKKLLPASGPFVLYVGNNKPHKNLLTGLKAFRHFRSQVGPSWSFVFAGASFQSAGAGAELLRYVESAGLADAVHFLGFLTPEQLRALYRCADMFLFPSRYEGFGLPPLEALACGTPVVSSNSSSLPEVLGDAALFAAPEDDVMMGHQMVQLATNEELNTKMKRAGDYRAREFKWETTVRRTLDIYRKVLGAA